ncbi:MAG: hypothetical protein C5B47_05770 [Verrucomicrobia bacterium]|nr:MAG: hypothetical protein C5B47_05770 [Verrucomicrobiota bacterium]
MSRNIWITKFRSKNPSEKRNILAGKREDQLYSSDGCRTTNLGQMETYLSIRPLPEFKKTGG